MPKSEEIQDTMKSGADEEARVCVLVHAKLREAANWSGGGRRPAKMGKCSENLEKKIEEMKMQLIDEEELMSSGEKRREEK